ncbi:MAG: hypothetical protein HN977_10780, partial [Gammaproteobacteria bacterium]|nr:hypothetical protein [Gammaproteobacteria bacterium]
FIGNTRQSDTLSTVRHGLAYLQNVTPKDIMDDQDISGFYNFTECMRAALQYEIETEGKS